MKGEHLSTCVMNHPLCKCNSCKKDNGSGVPCCEDKRKPCPVGDCPDFEPDDEEE